jgi:hypothetical protein
LSYSALHTSYNNVLGVVSTSTSTASNAKALFVFAISKLGLA